jgi:hypothetical protein
MGKTKKRRVIESSTGKCMALAEVCADRAVPGRYLCQRHLAALEQRVELIKKRKERNAQGTTG